MEFHADWAQALTEVQDDLVLTLDGGAKLIRDWERDVQRCCTMDRPTRDEARAVRYQTRGGGSGLQSHAHPRE